MAVLPADAASLAVMSTAIAGLPTAWSPDARTLDDRLLRLDYPYYEVFNSAYHQDPIGLGIVFRERQTVSEAWFGFSSLGGRIYEPSRTASRLEVLQDGRWKPLSAERRIDASKIGLFAKVQERGTVYWRYHFAAVEAEAIRIWADASEHTDPGFRCITLAHVSTHRAKTAAFDASEHHPSPRIPPWLLPGGNLLIGAERRQNRAFWSRPVMVSEVILSEDTPGVGLRYQSRTGWHDATVLDRLGRTIQIEPVATTGIWARGGELLKVSLGESGRRYFEKVRTSRSDLLGARFQAAAKRDLAEMESLLLPIDFTLAAIGRPADLHETMVLWDGKFLMVDGGEGIWPRDGSPTPPVGLDRWFTPLMNGEDLGQDPFVTFTEAVPGGYPATRTRHQRSGIEIEQTLFVTAPDDPYYSNMVLVEVRNGSHEERRIAIGYAMGLRPIWQPDWTPFTQDPWPTGYVLSEDGKTVRDPKGEVVMHSAVPGRLLGSDREPHFVIDLNLKAGESLTHAFSMPNVDAPVREAPIYDAALSWNRLKKWWDGVFDRFALDLPEQPFADAARNMVAQSMIVTLDGDEVRYGAYFYEMYFGIEEGWPAVALAQFGVADEAKKIIERMLADDHMDKANHHHQYRNGLAPWYAVTVARLLNDRDWLKSVWPRLAKAAEWTMSVTGANMDPGYGGILPKHVYGGDIATPAYSFYSNAVCWRGLHDTAEAAGWLGLPEASTYRSTAANYRKRLLELADRLVDRSDCTPFLPMAFEIGSGDSYRKQEPAYSFLATHSPSSDLWNYLGNYWNLFAPMLLEVRLFPSGDLRERWIPDRMEQGGGTLAGLVRFDLGLDTVYGKGYTESLLEQRRRDAFRTSLYGLFGHAVSRNLFAMPEVSGVFDLRTDNWRQYQEFQRMRWNPFYRFVGPWLEGWQGQEGDPLAAGAGMALQALRMSLVREDFTHDPPQSLVLLDGVPEQWFDPGKRISFKNLSTFLGTVTLEIDSSSDSIDATVTVPKDVPFAIRFPGERLERRIGTGEPMRIDVVR